MKITSKKPFKRLRILMVDRDMESVDLVKHTGFSLSFIEKVMCGKILPARESAEKLERFFNERIFSTPAQWRARRQKEKCARHPFNA